MDIQNGAQLGWLIDSKRQLTFIYRADGTVDKVEGFDKNLSVKMHYRDLNLTYQC